MAALLIIHFVIVIYCIGANSPTCDEIAHHIASGYSYLVTGDFRMNPANPPLIREISALPLLFLNVRLPIDSQAWKMGNSPVFGNEFFYKMNKNADSIIFWARIPMAILSVILGFLVFLWSGRLYGVRGGLLSLAVYSFCPNIIAFAALATVDLGASLFIFAALFSLWSYFKDPSKKKIIITGLCFGLAQASKYTSIFLIPIFVVLTICYYVLTDDNIRRPALNKRLTDLLSIFAIGYFVVFAAYFFETKPFIKNAPDIPEKVEYIKSAVGKLQMGKIGLNRDRAVWIAQNIPIPFSAYLVGLGGVAHQSSVGGYKTFLLGKVSDSGFWNYYVIAFLAKTTIPVILMFVWAIILTLRGDKKTILGALFLLLPIIIFFVIISMNKGQVGVRHILQIYPLIFVLIGSLNIMRLKDLLKYAVLAVLIILQIVSLASVLPYPISYFNELAGGPDNGYNILRDSNLDWGQGLKALKVYMEKNGTGKIKLFYFGTADPEYYNIPYEGMSESDFNYPARGVYAISAQYLDAVAWTKRYAPAAKIAHSIFIYEI